MAGILFALSAPKVRAASAYSDDASNYTDSYDGKNAGSGYGPFVVIAENDKPPFAGTFMASAAGTEKNAGNPNPESINTGGHAFGFYANGGSTASVTVQRTFRNGMRTPGDSFSINFVTGFNASGEVGVTLYTTDANVGNFEFVAGAGYRVDGKLLVSEFQPGALHLIWRITDTGRLEFSCDGAVKCHGSCTFHGIIVGFKVYAVNSGPGGKDYDGYFNSMNEIVSPVSIVH